MTIFGKNDFQPCGVQCSKSTILFFIAVAEAVCTATMATCAFFQFLVPSDKSLIFPRRVALILGNSFHHSNRGAKIVQGMEKSCLCEFD